MEEDRAEELQRSIDALLAKIEEQKRTIGSLLMDRGPRVVCAVKPPSVMPWHALRRRQPESITAL